MLEWIWFSIRLIAGYLQVVKGHGGTATKCYSALLFPCLILPVSQPCPPLVGGSVISTPCNLCFPFQQRCHGCVCPSLPPSFLRRSYFLYFGEGLINWGGGICYLYKASTLIYTKSSPASMFLFSYRSLWCYLFFHNFWQGLTIFKKTYKNCKVHLLFFHSSVLLLKETS